ncbi:MAG: M16 family metallopeptidase [Armatimonadota bacterium]
MTQRLGPMALGRSLLLLLLAALLLAGASFADSPKRLRLPNGLRVVLKPSSSTDVVAIELLLDISAADEPLDQQGIRNLVQQLLLRGTEAESGDAMVRRLAEVGAVAQATVGLDYVEVYALAPADGFEVALDVVAEAVQSPALDPAELEKQKAAVEQAALAARGDPFQESYLALRETLYPRHPYGGPTLGTPSSLDRIARDNLVSFHWASYIPNRAVIAICGGVGEARAMAAIRRAFGDWAPGPAAPAQVPPPAPLTMSDLVARERPVRQAHLMIGFPAPAAAQGDYYAVQLLDSILGGGATARLPRRLRDEMGVVYDISSFYPTLAHESHFVIYAVTEPSRLEAVKAAILELVGSLADSPVPDDELSRAKAYLLGSYALSHQRMKDEAYALAWYETLGLGLDFGESYEAAIQAATAQQVQQAAQGLFRRFVFSVVLPET